MRRILLGVGLCLCVIQAAAAQMPAATTQTGVATKGAEKIFTFTPPAFGQITATLSWDTQNARLIMVLVCGASEPETHGIAAGLLDRFARLEAGVIAGEPCGIGVGTLDETANFRLHLTRSGDQVVAPAAVGSVALVPAREGTLIASETQRALQRVRGRALR